MRLAFALVALGALATSSACGDSDACQAGFEGCECTAAQSCFSGLSCEAGVCVPGGGDGSGGSSAGESSDAASGGVSSDDGSATAGTSAEGSSTGNEEGSSEAGSVTGDGDGDGSTSSSTSTTSSSTSTTNSSSADSGSEVTTTGDGGSQPCFDQPANIDFVPPNLVFVLDKSGSMFNSELDYGGGVTKSFWQILHESIMAVITEKEDQIKFGANWFPTVHEPDGVNVFYPDGCIVEPVMQVPPALMTADDFLATLPGPTATGANSMITPAEGGYEQATAWINANVPQDEKVSMVLFMDGFISDGRPGSADCNDTDPLLENTVAGLTSAISANHAAGISTYVVGFYLTDGQVVSEMNGYAAAGGVPAEGGGFYSALNPAQLAEAFENIAKDVGSCDISVDVAAPQGSWVEVEIDGMQYGPIDPSECDSATGWHYIDGDTSSIRLCGGACDAFKDAPHTTVVEFFCPVG